MATQSPQFAAETRIIKICDFVNVFLLNMVMLTIPLFFIILTRDQFELPKLTVFRTLAWIMLGV